MISLPERYDTPDHPHQMKKRKAIPPLERGKNETPSFKVSQNTRFQSRSGLHEQLTLLYRQVHGVQTYQTVNSCGIAEDLVEGVTGFCIEGIDNDSHVLKTYRVGAEFQSPNRLLRPIIVFGGNILVRSVSWSLSRKSPLPNLGEKSLSLIARFNAAFVKILWTTHLVSFNHPPAKELYGTY
jgi:hypothetical protein